MLKLIPVEKELISNDLPELLAQEGTQPGLLQITSLLQCSVCHHVARSRALQ